MKKNNIDQVYIRIKNNLNNLSINDQIKELESFKYLILNSSNTGRKVRKKINGQTVTVPKKYLGKYSEVNQLLKQRIVLINNNKNIKKEIKNEPINTHDYREYLSLKNKIIQLKKVINKKSLLNISYEKLLEDVDKCPTYKEKNQLMRQFIKDNIVTFNFLQIKLNEVTKEDLETVVYEEDDINDQVLDIEKIEKPKNKKRLKKAFKSLAGVMGAILIISFFGSITNSVMSSQNTPSVVQTTITQATEATKSFEKVKSLTKTDNSTKDIKQVHKQKTVKKKTTTKKISKIKKLFSSKKLFNLNSKFKLQKDSLIYTNMYDAYNHSNSMNPYYDYQTVRKSAGVSVLYNNNLISIIQTDKDVYCVDDSTHTNYLTKKEANKYLNKLLKKGGQIKGVLSCHETYQNIEGFYNINNVKILK